LIGKCWVGDYIIKSVLIGNLFALFCNVVLFIESSKKLKQFG
jgi:hypothetical protein